MLEPGWHTYWRAPGGTGIPPRFDWAGSANLAGIGFEWPKPAVFETFGMRTIGYHGGLVLPVRLRPERPGAPIELRLGIEFGVCKDICIPAEAALSGSFDSRPGPAEGRALIEAVLARRAYRAGEAGVEAVECRAERNGRGHRLTASVALAAPPGREQVAVIEAASADIWIGEASARTEGATVTAVAELSGGLPESSTLRITLIDEDRAIDIEGCAEPR
ncbi:protein-disulfide reductase DsbD family protein [soil metagenome]